MSIPKDVYSQMQGMFGQLDNDQMKSAQNIWKMLDDLSENNPEEYKNFVQQNVKQGMSEMKQKKEEKESKLKINPKIGFVMKMVAKLDQFKLQKDQIPLYGKLVVNANLEDYAQMKQKLDKQVKLYFNVLYHSQVIGPQDQSGQEIKDIRQLDKWCILPLSVCKPQMRKSESDGTAIYFFDIIINEEVYVYMNSNVKLAESLMQFITEKMQDLLKCDRNPLLDKYKPLETNEIIYYKIEKLSIKQHSKKKYKYINTKINQIQPILLEPQYDREQLASLKKQQQQINQNANSIDAKKKEILIKNPLENNNVGNSTNSKVQDKVLDGLILKDATTNQSDKLSNQNQQQNKIVIEELQSQELITNQQQQVVEQPIYQMTVGVEEISIEIILNKVQSFKDINLDVSSRQLKLDVKGMYHLELQFKYLINNEQLNAKWDKKSKKLKLQLKKL